MAKQPKGISYTPVFEPDTDSMVKALKLLLERDNQKKGIAEKAEKICYRSLRSQFFYPKQAISRVGQLNMSFLQKLWMTEQELKKKRQIN